MITCGNHSCIHNKKGMCTEKDVTLRYGNIEIPKGKRNIVDNEEDITDGYVEYLICEDFKW